MPINSVMRAIANTAPAQQAIQTVRAATTVRPARLFLAGQATRRQGAYRLRESGARVQVRHRTRDIAILSEIFAKRTYAPPIPLNGPLDILDLGGNIGLFGLFALSEWDVRSIRSYEPDPDNVRLLRSVSEVHAMWTVIAAAASSRSGEMRFAAGMHSESREADEGAPCIVVPAVDVYSGPRANLAKIDIEGGEWPILTDARLPHLADVIVLEWHARGCPSPDAHAGYVHQRDAAYEHDGNGLLWAWRA